MYFINRYFPFIRMYGLRRSLIKHAGRKRNRYWWIKFLMVQRKSKRRHVSIIGCGQFAFSTICYFLHRRLGNCFKTAFDTETQASQSLADFWAFSHVAQSADEIIQDHETREVYISSNHSSHIGYASQALEAGKRVHIEKPLVTNWQDYQILVGLVAKFADRMSAGYNRPFAKAIKRLKTLIENDEPLMIQANVWAHNIEETHWYRMPGEGTRICGNAGHWIDLAVHLWHEKGSLGQKFELNLQPADKGNADDNFTLTIRNEFNELFTLGLYSLQEPLFGIQEQIFLYQRNLTAIVDDFQKLSWQKGESIGQTSYFRKDVGHENCILQLVDNKIRPWQELLISTQLILHVTDMVNEKCFFKEVRCSLP